jgi:hypothetical protein
MSWSDPIVDDVRRVRDAYAARFNYDLRAIYRDLKEQEKRSGRKFVSFVEDSAAQQKQTQQRTGPAPPLSHNIPSQHAGPVSEL